MCFWFCPVGGALVDTGEGLQQMADVKDALDISVKQNFIDPLQNLQDNDLKEITVCFSRLCVFLIKAMSMFLIPSDSVLSVLCPLETYSLSWVLNPEERLNTIHSFAKPCI